MKYLLLLTAFLAVMASSSAQENPDCGWYGTKTVAERNAMFPFNKAKKVVLVSYYSPFEAKDLKSDLDTITKLKVVRGVYGSDIYNIIETKELDQDWINQLSHILVNYTIKKKKPGEIILISETACYDPRNSILFYDENNTIICCYEICFYCFKTNMWPDPDDVNGYADVENCKFTRIDELKHIFRKNGITYGIDEK